jgi:hypothetical protein
LCANLLVESLCELINIYVIERFVPVADFLKKLGTRETIHWSFEGTQ